jgi:hypothetical protein
MGSLTTAGKNLALDALRGTNPTTPITHAALFDSAPAQAPTGATPSTFTLTAHGLVNGDLVVFDSKTGGTGIRLGYAYFVIGSTANTFQLSETPGGTAVDMLTAVTASSIRKLVELTGGTPAYARKAIAFAASVVGSMDDTTAPTFDVPGGVTVDYMGLYSALTAGTLLQVDDLTAETFAAQGSFQLTDVDVDLNQ